MGEIRPYICTSDARRAIDWYGDVRGAEGPRARSSWTTAGSATPCPRDPFGHRWMLASLG